MHKHTLPSRQRGAATLVVTIALFLALLLVAIYVNRNLVFEQRASANQARSTQAFEAAEAGLEWAVAQLNTPARIGVDCLPSAAAGASSFRERYLAYDRAAGVHTIATWLRSGVASPRLAGCVRGAAAWECSCPASGLLALTAPTGTATAPAFTLHFEPSAQAGIVRLVSTGCSSLAGLCAAGAGTTVDATARVEVALALLPALKTAPAAALTARGSIDGGAAMIGLRNNDAASGGIAAHAGGAINASAARVTGPAGSTGDEALVASDTTLAGTSDDAYFVSYFGMSRAEWQAQAVVKPVICPGGDCSATLLTAIEPAVVNPLIHVAGDLQIDGPVVIGSADRPVLIVVDGSVSLRGAVVVHGLVYGRTLQWGDSAVASGALLHGAAISEGSYSGNGAPDIVYDAEILSTLKGRAGSLARVNGSWRDF